MTGVAGLYGAEIVTVAVRRTNMGQNPGEPNLLDVLAAVTRNDSDTAVRDAAETAWFAADSKGDWASAAIHEQEREQAAQELIRSVAWGFFLPLALVVAAEIDMGIRRAPRRDSEGPR